MFLTEFRFTVHFYFYSFFLILPFILFDKGVPRSEGNRRYSNISNLARSIRSEPGTNGLQTVTGSLEILAILDPNLSQLGNRRR